MSIEKIVKKTTLTILAVAGFGWWWYNGYQERHKKDSLEPDAVVVNENSGSPIEYIDVDSNGRSEAVLRYVDPPTGKTKYAKLTRTDTGIIGSDTNR